MLLRPLLASCLLLMLVVYTPAGAQKANYLRYIEEAAEQGWRDYPEGVERWRANVDPSVLWGYNSTAQPIYLADILGFLYQQTGDETYATRAAQLLAEYGDLRSAYPDDYYRTRIEYENGVPSLANFFFLPPYSRSYLRIRDSQALDAGMRAKIEEDLAFSLDFQFSFPEWGAHNRAMLRAEGWYYGYLAMPDHPNALRWKQMAENIARDNLAQWEVEDASSYHPIWLVSIFSYAEISGNEHLLSGPILHYYAEYFKRLITPAGTMPDFGDATWDPSWDRFAAAFEWLAARFDDPELKWAARQIAERGMRHPGRGTSAASHLALAYEWADESLPLQTPTSGSQEVLEDVVGKKIVFRGGWEPSSSYLLLNYRDEGDGGFNSRQYLRQTLTVEEEKMHHGHADENDISLLMDGGSVLLHDGGYRNGLPSGPYGSYRSDYFHNRLVVRKNKRDTLQAVRDFIRNSGAYRPVRTMKIDFIAGAEADMSRTRVLDATMGYVWDRSITYLKEDGIYLVVDAVKSTVEDYLTHTLLWHTRQIHDRGPGWYDTSIDSIQSIALPADRRLLIQMLTRNAKTDGYYDEERHGQWEKAIYQSQSSHYRPGDVEVFVTALIPHDAGADLAPLLGRISLLPPDPRGQGVGIRIERADGSVSTLGIKVDLDAEVATPNIRPRYTWEAGRTRYGAFETDAHFFLATERAGRVDYAASEFLNIFYNNQPVREALPNTHGLQPDGSEPRVGYTKWRYWEDRFMPRP
ncbi:MAG: hypothetical protein SH809_08595 [Rhodothermales bacterium]|nr:hypothetical protein [Rhodothermales bacterium]